MITPEQFDQLQVGGFVDVEGLLKPVTGEPIVLRVTERGPDKIEFVVTYFGVTLGKWRAQKADGAIKWQL